MIAQIPEFSMSELRNAVKSMSNNQAADKHVIVIEMIKYTDTDFYEALLKAYNDILQTGQIEQDWHDTIFQILPKSGDLKLPGN